MKNFPQKTHASSPYIWISAAETSGDIHGANLIGSLAELTEDYQFIGIGGPEMRSKEFSALIRSEELSVMGFTEVLGMLPKILGILRRNKQLLRAYMPRCIILIDAPDYHFRIAKIASKLGIPVYYYISPQIWAWRKRRVYFMRKYVQKILCIIPFEKEFYASYGIDVEFVGHPLLQYMDLPSLDSICSSKRIIAILPGSRKKEISSLLPHFAEAAGIIKKHFPDTEFYLIRSPHIEEGQLENLWPPDLPCSIIQFSERYQAIRECTAVMTASGTASLECAILNIPTVVAYKLSWISYQLGKLVVDVPYISLPNLIQKKRVFPEFIQSDVNAEKLAAQILEWLKNPSEMQEVKKELLNIRQMLGKVTASHTAAEIILRDIRCSDKEFETVNAKG